MEAIRYPAGSLLVSMVSTGLHVCGVWELHLQGSSPCRRVSLVWKACFPNNSGTVVVLPWCYYMSFLFFTGGAGGGVTELW